MIRQISQRAVVILALAGGAAAVTCGDSVTTTSTPGTSLSTTSVSATTTSVAARRLEFLMSDPPPGSTIVARDEVTILTVTVLVEYDEPGRYEVFIGDLNDRGGEEFCIRGGLNDIQLTPGEPRSLSVEMTRVNPGPCPPLPYTVPALNAFVHRGPENLLNEHLQVSYTLVR